MPARTKGAIEAAFAGLHPRPRLAARPVLLPALTESAQPRCAGLKPSSAAILARLVLSLRDLRAACDEILAQDPAVEPLLGEPLLATALAVRCAALVAERRARVALAGVPLVGSVVILLPATAATLTALRRARPATATPTQGGAH